MVGIRGITAKEAFKARSSTKSKKQAAFATPGQSVKDTREEDSQGDRGQRVSVSIQSHGVTQ